jgi:hypothetical protein
MNVERYKTVQELNAGERSVLQVLLTGGKHTAVEITNRIGTMQHNTCVKWADYLIEYGKVGSIPYKIISQQEPGKHTHQYWIDKIASSYVQPQATSTPAKKKKYSCPNANCRADSFYWQLKNRSTGLVECTVCYHVFTTTTTLKEAE